MNVQAEIGRARTSRVCDMATVCVCEHYVMFSIIIILGACDKRSYAIVALHCDV